MNNPTKTYARIATSQLHRNDVILVCGREVRISHAEKLTAARVRVEGHVGCGGIQEIGIFSDSHTFPFIKAGSPADTSAFVAA